MLHHHEPFDIAWPTEASDTRFLQKRLAGIAASVVADSERQDQRAWRGVGCEFLRLIALPTFLLGILIGIYLVGVTVAIRAFIKAKRSWRRLMRITGDPG